MNIEKYGENNLHGRLNPALKYSSARQKSCTGMAQKFVASDKLELRSPSAAFREAASMVLSWRTVLGPEGKHKSLAWGSLNKPSPGAVVRRLRAVTHERVAFSKDGITYPEAHLLFFLFFFPNRIPFSAVSCFINESPTQRQSPPFRWQRAKGDGLLQVIVPLPPWDPVLFALERPWQMPLCCGRAFPSCERR